MYSIIINNKKEVSYSMRVCAFTGHRPDHFPFKYDESHPDCVRLKNRMLTEVINIAYAGTTLFLSGMAQGVDTWGAEIVLEMRQTCSSLRLVCVLPCADQVANWTDEAKKRYFSILCRANRLICLHEHYTDRCMMERNRFMVDHADSLLAVCNPKIRSGSTATLHYAQAKGIPVNLIDTRKI